MFYLFEKLPAELQDYVWELVLPPEIMRPDQRDAHISGIPTIASVCKGARETVLRCGVWLTTPQSWKPMFFIPDRSVLHCGRELTVTANQVMLGFDGILMRTAVRFNALKLLKEIIILISDDKPEMIPTAWRKTSDRRALSQIEIYKTEDAYGTDDGRPAQPRTCSEEDYHPRAEWTSERWEEVKTAAKRAWLLAAWHAKDPANVQERDILDPSKWYRTYWIKEEICHMPKLTAGYMRKSV
ncbi:hypothetical protein F5B21DRAFT_9117 [Xylaria acuta]|nr:hypothetical protein F5B21DRAFT_9117 [Xylaria acuta]